MQNFIISSFKIIINNLLNLYISIFKTILYFVNHILFTLIPVKYQYIPQIISFPLIYIYTLSNFTNTLINNGILSSKISLISDKYNHLLTPADSTFSIWIIIYSLLFIIIVTHNPYFYKNENINHFYQLNQGINNNLELNIQWIFEFTNENFCQSSNTLKHLIKNLSLEIIPKLKYDILKKIFMIYLAWSKIADIQNTIIKKIKAKEINEDSLNIIINYLEINNFSFKDILSNFDDEHENEINNKITHIVYLWAFSGILKGIKSKMNKNNNTDLNNKNNIQINNIYESLHEIINYINNLYHIDIDIDNFKINKFIYLIFKELITSIN